MPTSLRRNARHLRRGVWYVIAMALVLVALLAGVTSQLLPLAERHPDRIASWLSARAGRTVSFDSVDTEWTRRGPLLRVAGLRIGDGAAAVPVGEAEILVSQYAGLLPGRSFTELRLRHLALTVERAADGRWSVRGFPGQPAGGGDPMAALEGLGELQVIAARLAVVAPELGLDARIPRVDLRLRVEGDRLRLGARAWMRRDHAPLAIAMDLARGRGDGMAYAGAREVELSAWAPLLRIAGVMVEQGGGRAAAWARVRGHRVDEVTVDAALDGLLLRSAAVDPVPAGAVDTRTGSVAASGARFGRIELKARWRQVDGGWQVHAPHLRVGDAGALQTLDGLLVAGGRRYGLLADRIDVGPLLAVAALSDRLPPRLRRWMASAVPGAVAHGVRVVGTRGGAVRINGRIDRGSFRPVGTAPGLQGLAGTLVGDASGLVFTADARSPVRVDWPHGLPSPHDVALRGQLVAWGDGEGWRVGTSGLRVQGDGYAADLQGHLHFQGDGTRPIVNLAARLDDSRLATAKRFWTVRTMRPALVRWLDAALVSGTVGDGRVLLSGDLDDWPFRGHAGTFDAHARVSDVVLAYQPGWPASDRLDADVHFFPGGFQVTGAATVAGMRVPRFTGGIAEYGVQPLQVRASVDTDAARILAFIRRSPLQQRIGTAIANLSATGPATGTFALDLPLGRDAATPRIGGSVTLAGATLAEREWKLAFGAVRGRIDYDRDGLHSDGLAVTQEGQPGRLSVRTGRGHVRDPAQAFEADLAASLTVASLLDRAPQLGWLKPHVAGRSPWTVAIAIPASAAAATGRAAAPRLPARLQLRSTLVGTTLDLPAPLDKPAAAALLTTVETALPFGAADITVAFGDRLALRARSTANRTGLRAVLGASRVTESPPPSGLVASGRTDDLDAIGWVGLTRGGTGGSGLPLRQVDVTAGRLHLLGAAFAQTRVRASPTAGGIGVQLDGPMLAGGLLLPDAPGGTIAGRLQRLHWRGAGQAPKPVATAAAVPPADDIDPAAIPALNLVVDDLRVGDMQAGSASLRTRPTASGMRIERLQTRASGQRIDASGDWSGRGGAARTRIEVAMASEDFGRLLRGVGFGGRIDGGKGDARFKATWPGSPADFKVGSLDGSLELLAKDGRLVEIEPGAGRVLGLLSLAEIPRRLTLDFRDFFSKGFAFNRIAGTIAFAGGQARSDDLVIEGPAADISIRGAANLRAQTFDQTIEVVPKTGNLLTAVGAIAGGPVGAAVGAMANAVLNKPLGQISARTYRVTGPWKDPKVEVIGREQSRATPPANANAG